MARNVTDAAVLLGAATGVDPDDAATADQAGNAFTDYTQFLDDEALDGARIGVWRAGTYRPGRWSGPVVEPILDDVIEALEDEGATVIEGTDIDLSATANEFPALLCEFKTDIATYLETYVRRDEPEDRPGLSADPRRADRVQPGASRARGSLERRRLRGCRGDERPRRRMRRPPRGRDAAGPGRDRQLMAENDLDAIIALTNGPAWPTNDNPAEGDLDGHFEYFVGSSSAAAVSGYADITVPAGYIAGLPIGITFIGGRWAEPELLGLAYDYEQATQVRVPPQFIPTIGDDLFPGVPNPPDQAQAQRQQATQGQRDLVVRFR